MKIECTPVEAPPPPPPIITVTLTLEEAALFYQFTNSGETMRNKLADSALAQAVWASFNRTLGNSYDDSSWGRVCRSVEIKAGR